MPIRHELEFYHRRERQERTLAERAHHEAGRRVHLEMARRYAALIAEAQQDTPTPTPTLCVRA